MSIQLNETIKVKVREARHRWENGLREKTIVEASHV